MNGTAFSTLRSTWKNLGVPYILDFNGGKLHGYSSWPFTQKDDIRQDSARAYYWPVAAKRPNLHVFLNTTGLRIQWAKQSANQGLISATGVEVVRVNGTKSTITASREVILSAGSIRSPLLLEQSGVGNPQYVTRVCLSTPKNHSQ